MSFSYATDPEKFTFLISVIGLKHNATIKYNQLPPIRRKSSDLITIKTLSLKKGKNYYNIRRQRLVERVKLLMLFESSKGLESARF